MQCILSSYRVTSTYANAAHDYNILYMIRHDKYMYATKKNKSITIYIYTQPKINIHIYVNLFVYRKEQKQNIKSHDHQHIILAMNHIRVYC